MSPNSTTENPNEKLQIPKWINEDYFQEILLKDVPNFSKVISFNPIAATSPGENYTSIMVRVGMDVELKDGSTQKVSYILKTALEGGNDGATLVSSMNLFPKEKLAYEVFIPQFEKLYKDAGVDLHFGPKCLHVEQNPEFITLVMEDLKLKKFANCDRLNGLDLSHMTHVLRKLAEWHAASTVYYELNGPYDEMFNKTFFSESNRHMLEAMANQRRDIFLKAMRGWGLENVENYISTLPPTEVSVDEMLRLNKFDPKDFNVLNHGDLWSNNIMFKYKDNGEIDQTLFVDYQVGKWGTPAQDLWYIIVTSAQLDIKVKEFDRFIAIYHARLVECLKLLKYTKAIPTLKELHIMMLKNGFWGIMTSNGVLSAVLLPPDEDANMDNLMNTGPEGDKLIYKTLTNAYYSNAMRQLMPFFKNKGLLHLPERQSN